MSKKRRKSAYWVQQGCWPVYICLCNNEAAFISVFKRLSTPKDEKRVWCGKGTGKTWTIDNDVTGGRVIVVCCDAKTIPTLADRISHEATHVMQSIEEFCAPDGFDPETQAYIVGWIVREWFDNMR